MRENNEGVHESTGERINIQKSTYVYRTKQNIKYIKKQYEKW